MAKGKKRVIFLKLSGERLGKEGVGWSAQGVAASAEKLARVYKQRGKLGIDGIVLVPGAGNIIRGDKLKRRGVAPGREDLLGRAGTVMNSIVIGAELKKVGVPTATFIAKSMAFRDGDFGMERYSAAKLQKAFSSGRLVIIAGGSGEDNVTTDYAVAFYAGAYKRYSTNTEVVVLKGTKWDGVFEADPSKNKGVRCYRTIGAPMMLSEYSRFSAVDERSLKEIIKHGLEMLVYADDKHDLEAVLRHDLSPKSDKRTIGTLILAADVAPVFY